MFKLFTSVFVVFLLGSAGTSFAAESTKPGDFLYPVKTEINERVRGWFNFSYIADLDHRVSLLEERLSEIEALVKEGKLTPELAVEAQAKVVAEIESINKSTGSVKLSDLSPQDKKRLSEALGRLKDAVIKYRDSLVALDNEADKSKKKKSGGGGRKSTTAVVGEVIVDLSEQADIEVEEEVELILEEEAELEEESDEMDETSNEEESEDDNQEDIAEDTDSEGIDNEEEEGDALQVDIESETEVESEI